MQAAGGGGEPALQHGVAGRGRGQALGPGARRRRLAVEQEVDAGEDGAALDVRRLREGRGVERVRDDDAVEAEAAAQEAADARRERTAGTRAGSSAG